MPVARKQPFRVSPGECSGQLGCRTRQRKVQLNSRTEAEIMPLCQYCDNPQVTPDGVYRSGQQFELLKRSGSYVWTDRATSRARSRNDKVNQYSGSEVTRRDS